MLTHVKELSDLLRGVVIDMQCTHETVDFTDDRVLALRFGPDPNHGTISRIIATSPSIIVASPAWVAIHGDGLNAISRGALLSLTRQPGLWARVLAQLGIEQRPREVSFDSMEGILQAAQEGHGLALLPLLVSEDRIAAGKLVRLACPELLNEWAYRLVARQNGPAALRLEVIAKWLTAKVEAQRRTVSQVRT